MHVIGMLLLARSTRPLRALLCAALLVLLASPAAGHAEGTSGLRYPGVTPRSLGDDEVELPQRSSGRAAPTGRSGIASAVTGDRTLLVLRVYYDGEGWSSTSALDAASTPSAGSRIASRATSPPPPRCSTRSPAARSRSAA